MTAMDRAERDRLLKGVREWFGDSAQREHYVAEAPSGPTPAEAALLASLGASSVRVVDLGCGAGRIALALAARGHDVVGADVSMGMVEVAREAAVQRRLTARFVATDPLMLPFGAESVDAVVAVKVYFFIPSRAARLAYLDEIARVLRPGRPLLLTTYFAPEEEALATLAADEQHREAAKGFESLEPLDTFVQGRGYVHWFTRESLLAELSESAFAVQDVQEDRERRQLLLRMRVELPKQ